MPRTTKYPRLRLHVRKGARGQVKAYYYYDMRPEGEPDVPLGSDYDEALRRWSALHTNRDGGTTGLLQEAFDQWRFELLPRYRSEKTRTEYAKHLRRLEAWCGRMAWGQVTLPLLAEYAARRTGKTQANRELSLLAVIWGKARIWGMVEQPWPAYGLKGWKNPEKPRPPLAMAEQVFAAVRKHGDPLLKDAIDLAIVTSLRLTDCRHLRMPVDGVLDLSTSKVGKPVRFIVANSPTLSRLVAQRAIESGVWVDRMLVGRDGLEVSERQLTEHWAKARRAAAAAADEAGHTELATAIRSAILREGRKVGANQAPTLKAAQQRLQHDSERTTRRHYRTAPETIPALDERVSLKEQ